MVGLFEALLPLLFATLAAAADLQITSPSSDRWWVDKSENVMAWNCDTQVNQPNGIYNFTVLINNTNPDFAGPLAFIAIQQNADCSTPVTQDQVNQPAATGYTLVFANPLNNSDIYAKSELFEIKALGSQYPPSSSVASSIASSTGASTPSASAHSAGTFTVHSPSFMGLVGALALLAAGVIGA